MARVYTRNFDSDTVGQLPAGWTNITGSGWTVSTVNPISTPNSFHSTENGNVGEYIQSAVLLTNCAVGFTFRRTVSPYRPHGLALRMNGVAHSAGYIVFISPSINGTTNVGTANLLYRDGSGWNEVSSGDITVAGSPVNNSLINVEFKAVGSTLTLTMWADGTTKPTSGTGTRIWTDTAVTGAGYPGLYAQENAGSVDNFYVDDLIDTTYTVTGPVGGAVGAPSTNFTLAVNGTITSTVFTPSDSAGGGTFNPTTVTLSGVNPTGTFTYTPGTAGTKTISVTNNGGLVNPASVTYTASIGLTSVGVDDSHITWMPGAWDRIPLGTYSVSAISRQSANSGASFRFSVTGSTDVSVLLDPTISTAVVAGYKPRLVWSVDGVTQLSAAITNQISIPILTGQASATRQFEVWIITYQDGEASRYSLTNGISLANGVRIQGVSFNTSGSIGNASLVRPASMLFYGDSITEGQMTVSTSVHNPRYACVDAVATYLSAYAGQIGFGSQGWTLPGSAGADFPVTYDKFSIDRPRTVTGFDYVFVMHGTNDGYNSVPDASVRADVSGWLASARTSYGATTKIFLVSPPGGYSVTGIQNGYNDYIASHPSDTSVYFLNLAPDVPISYFNNTTTGIYSFDGLHPQWEGNVLISNEIISQLDALHILSTPVSFSSVTANGTSGTVTTTALTLTFDVEPVGLVATDITVTGATRGALTGSGLTRTLAISNITVANGETVNVQIASPSGYSITPTNRNVVVNVYVYHMTGVTRDNTGVVLGSIQVSLLRNTGSGVFSYIGTQVSNATTGAYSFEVPNNTYDYCVVAFGLNGSTRVMDVTDNNLRGV